MQTLLGEQVSSGSSTCPSHQELSANLLLNIYCFPLCSAWCQALDKGTREQGTGNYTVNDHLPGAMESSQQPCSESLNPIFAAGEMRLRVGKTLVRGHTASEPRSRVSCVGICAPASYPPPQSQGGCGLTQTRLKEAIFEVGCGWNPACPGGHFTTIACLCPALSLPLAHPALPNIPSGAYYYLHLTDEGWRLREVK